MNFRIILDPDVETDLEAAYLYIAERAPQAAVDWYNRCLDAIQSLKRFPNRCPLAPETAAFGRDIRQYVVESYRILFVVEGNTVHVLHVRHGARRPLGPFE